MIKKGNLADDILRGVREISEFTGDDLRKMNHKLATGALPAGKLGGKWIASKSVLRSHYEKLTSGRE